MDYMRELKFYQIDVFTSVPFKGNPVAVVFDADDFSDETMQRIANWTNLSETVFIQSSSNCDYKLRIFSTNTEFKFAVHPTLGSLFALIEAGRLDPLRDEFHQESNIGQVLLQKDGEALYVRMPMTKATDFTISGRKLSEIAGSKIISDAIAFDVGPVWLTAAVRNFEALNNIRVKSDQASSLYMESGISGFTFYCTDKNHNVYVRTFAPALGVTEDPVCGSGNAAVAAHLKLTEVSEFSGIECYTAFQGSALGRDGVVNVKYDNNDIYIGGRSVSVIEGIIRF